MKRILFGLLLGLAAFGQPQIIADSTVTAATGGGLFAGRIVVSLNSPGSASPLYYGTTSLTGSKTTYCLGLPKPASDCDVSSVAGTLNATLYATSTITPTGTSYSAVYTPLPGKGNPYTHTWLVPVSVSALKVYQLGTTVQPVPNVMVSPAAITSGGATALQVLQYSGTSWGPATLSALTDPTTTAGDLIYQTGSGLTRLGLGTLGYCLTAGASAPSWAACGGGGSGTVTSVSVTTANGVSGSVATATTTPAITLTLGAITPSSVAATGNVTGLNLSGTNTGDQTTITGNAGTATALAANGSNCSAGQFPLGVDASGASESCTALPTTISGTANQITASAATGAVTLSIPTNPTLPGTTTGTFSGNLTGNVTGNASGTSGSTTGNAATATALAANGTNCSGSLPRGIDASGNAEGCADADLTTEVTGILPNANTTATSANTASAIVARDSSGNFAAGAITATSFASTGSGAGSLELTQGTAPSLGTTSIKIYAPTSVTSYGLIPPSASATGFLLGTDSSNINTLSFVGFSGTGNVARVAGPTFTTPTLGVATGTSFNGLTITTSTGSLTVANGKTLTASNSLTLAGTDSTTMTFPTTNATIARTDAANTWAGGAQDMGAATSWKMPVGAGATTATNGFLAYDSTANMLHAAQSSADAYIPQATITPVNNDCIKWVVSGSQYKLGSAGAACGTSSAINRQISLVVVDPSSTGTKSCSVIEVAGTIVAAHLLANALPTGANLVVDVKKVAYSSYTGIAAASSITASAVPTIATGDSNPRYEDTTLTGWTTSVSANDVVCVAVNTAPSGGATWASLTLEVQ